MVTASVVPTHPFSRLEPAPVVVAELSGWHSFIFIGHSTTNTFSLQLQRHCDSRPLCCNYDTGPERDDRTYSLSSRSLRDTRSIGGGIDRRLVARHKHTTLTLQCMCASRRHYIELAQRASHSNVRFELLESSVPVVGVVKPQYRHCLIYRHAPRPAYPSGAQRRQHTHGRRVPPGRATTWHSFTRVIPPFFYPRDGGFLPGRPIRGFGVRI